MPSYQDLAIDLAAQAPALRLRITGSSMAPLLQDGEAIILQPIAWKALQPGDIIAFRHIHDTITHRIISINPQGITTLGDNLRKPDPFLSPDALLGRVIALEKNGHIKSLSTGAWPSFHRFLAKLGKQTTLPRARWIILFFRILFLLARKSARIYLLL
ncbi:MAG: hypothetical protein Fur0022_34980 [Anaerolineales bacterium]